MTAIAMMVPIALGLGEGGEQNPRWENGDRRSIVATIATLFYVPTVFAAVRRHKFYRHRKSPRYSWVGVLDLLKRKRPGKKNTGTIGLTLCRSKIGHSISCASS
jgi:hypothetical protein